MKLSELVEDLGSGSLHDAYVELSEVVGHDAALDHLFDVLLGPITLDDGTAILRSDLTKNTSKRRQ